VRRRLARLAPPLALALALAAPAARASDPPVHTRAEVPDEPPAALEEGSAPAPGAAPPTADPGVPPPAPVAPGDAPPAGPGPGAPEAEPADAREGRPRRGWLDSSHDYLEEKLLAPVMRLDRFFSDETDLEAERARSFLRWRSELRFEEAQGTPRFRTGVRANLRFPALTRALRRLRLVIEGETQEAFSALFPGDGTAGSAGSDAPIGRADAELRFGLWDGLVSHADLGAGVLFELPPGAFGRLRLRWVIPIDGLFLTRFAVVGFYRTDERFGTSTDLHLERPVLRATVVRLSSEARLTQVSPGIEWRSELAAFVGLGRRAAGAFGVGVNGATRREPVELERFRVFTRLRRDFYRRWLFFELEPEYAWPYTPDRGRHPVWAVTTRLEVQFHGRERARDPDDLDVEPPDPPDPPASPARRSVAPGARSR
jgi:hypothetical protein